MFDDDPLRNEARYLWMRALLQAGCGVFAAGVGVITLLSGSTSTAVVSLCIGLALVAGSRHTHRALLRLEAENPGFVGSRWPLRRGG